MIPLLVAALAVASPSATPILTLDQALALARSHQPTLVEARAGVAAASARQREALAPLLPQLAGNAGAQHRADLGQSGGLVGGPGGAGGPGDSGSFGLTLTQQIWDFGQGQLAWNSAGAQVAASKDTASATALAVDFDVRQAYFTAWGDRKLVAVAQESLSDQRAHLRQIQGAVEVGTRPLSDLAQIRASVASAQVALIDAQDAEAIARAQLAQAIGAPLPSGFAVADAPMAPVPGEGESIDALVQAAIERRPDRLSLDQQIRSQHLTSQAARLSGAPKIAASANVAADTQAGLPESNQWGAGLSMSWPLVEGGAVLARAAEADANLASLRAQRDALDQQIRLDVAQAELALRGAQAGVKAAQVAVEQAQVSLKLADGRYAVGLGSAVDLADAQQQLTTAEGQRIQEEVKLDTARAELIKALAL